MTKGELIELLIGYPDDSTVSIDLGDVEEDDDWEPGIYDIVAVQEDDGEIFLCPFPEEEGEPESQDESNVIDVPFREIKTRPRRKTA